MYTIRQAWSPQAEAGGGRRKVGGCGGSMGDVRLEGHDLVAGRFEYFGMDLEA